MKTEKQHRTQVSATFAPRVLLIEWTLIAIAAYLCSFSNHWLLLPAVLIIGRGQWTLMDNIGHWATHATLFPNKKNNKSLECLYFLPVFITFMEWKTEHFRHHAFLGTNEDPENITFNRWRLGKHSYTMCLILTPVYDFKKNLYQLKVWRNKSLCMFWIVALFLVFTTNAWLFLGAWLMSHFFIKPYFMFISETAEHWQAPDEDSKKLYGSRILIGTFFVLFKAYGDHLHRLHHQHPTIPPDRLHEFYKTSNQSNQTDFPTFLNQMTS